MTSLEMKDEIIGSKMYPSISFTDSKSTHNNITDLQQSLPLSASLNIELPNNYRPIQSHHQTNSDLSPPTTSQKIQFYLALLRKLFPQLCQQSNKQQISSNNIWVCENVITTYPILLYFINGHRIPIMNCCWEGVIVEMESQLCGWVKCAKCGKIGFEFVHLIPTNSISKAQNRKQMQKSPKTQFSQHKQNNFMIASPPNQKLSSLHRDNELLFKQYKSMNQNNKENVRKLISSNQHRQKSIKKMMGITADVRQYKDSAGVKTKQVLHSSKSNSSLSIKPIQKNNEQLNKEIKNVNNEYDDFIFRDHKNSQKTTSINNIEIGQLIIQIPPQKYSSGIPLQKDKISKKLNKKHKLNMNQTDENNQYYQLNSQDVNLDPSLRELKQIISEIFS